MVSAQVGLWVVILLVVLALIFDFMNGFHDAANSIATVVSTGVLKPGQAVLFAAIFNFVAIFVFQLTVAATIGKDWRSPAWWMSMWCLAPWWAPSAGISSRGITAFPAVPRMRSLAGLWAR